MVSAYHRACAKLVLCTGRVWLTLHPPLLLLMLQSCSSVVFFEVRKKQDLYIWMSKTPHGPSVKFHVTNGEETCCNLRACVCVSGHVFARFCATVWVGVQADGWVGAP